jgi:hypothetical protein
VIPHPRGWRRRACERCSSRGAPRSVFLIYADPGLGGENTRQPTYYAAAGEPKAIWKVPGSKHTGGIDARPAEYEQRVIAFFDRALLESN